MPEDSIELSYEEFVLARRRHWLQEVDSVSEVSANPNAATSWLAEEDSHFLLYAPGANGIFGVFEDAGEKGWFYLYRPSDGKILKGAQIYSRSDVLVDEDVVDLGWASDGSVCGVAIWGEFRAFLSVSGDLGLCKPVMDMEERGIPSGKWPAGFERYLEEKLD